jgi:chloride channel 3/4/5
MYPLSWFFYIYIIYCRRYEDFTTIDWIQDSILERNRRIRHANKVYASSQRGPRGEITRRWLWAQLWKMVDAGQTWFVVSLVGEYLYCDE